MEKYLIALSLVCILFSCNGQVNPAPPKDQAKQGDQGNVGITDIALVQEDPYFVVTKDTMTTTGPHNITRNVLEDRDGNMWLATWEGIIRFDGKQFVNYTLKESLRKFHVFSVLEDRDGNIWFGTIRGGLYRYDPAADPTSPQYDPKNPGRKPFTLFTTNEGLANDMVLCMMQDRAGLIWFGTDDGVSVYNPSLHEDGKSNPNSGSVFTNYTTVEGLSGQSVNSIMEDAAGRIWFGTRYGVKGDVCYYDGKSFTRVNNALGMPFTNARMIIEDRKGIIWIGGQDGLYRYDPSTTAKSIDHLMTNITKDFIGYIYEDKAGNLWLSQASPEGMSLKRYDGKVSHHIATHGQVFGILEDRKGNIWFGTPGGIVRYDGKSFEDFLD